jgi:hypothetical protein
MSLRDPSVGMRPIELTLRLIDYSPRHVHFELRVPERSSPTYPNQ